MNNEYIYPIKVVADKTGLTAHVIRAWEKRYSAIEPGRTDTKRRLYSEKDIHRLTLLGKITKAGYNIGSIANLPLEALEKLAGEGKRISQSDSGNNKTNYYLTAGLQCIEDLDEKRLEENLLRASVDMSQPTLMEELLIPLIKRIGDNWKSGSLRIYHEHLVSAVIKTFLSNLRSAYKADPGSPQLIIATPI